jgi:hypothetical protein
MINEIKKDKIVYARLITDLFENAGLNFYSNNDEYIQVGTWNYNQKILAAHNHNLFDRSINRTQEVIIPISGRIMAKIFNEEDKYLSSFEVLPGQILILLNGGHEFEILESGTKVIEIKNGPYAGAERDRRRLNE